MKKLKSFFIAIGVLAAVLILFFILTRFLPTKENRYISELENLMRPLDVSELNILFFTLDTTRDDQAEEDIKSESGLDRGIKIRI